MPCAPRLAFSPSRLSSAPNRGAAPGAATSKRDQVAGQVAFLRYIVRSESEPEGRDTPRLTQVIEGSIGMASGHSLRRENVLPW